jgi:hypothetical protein
MGIGPSPEDLEAIPVPFGFESDVRSDIGPYYHLAIAGIRK